MVLVSMTLIELPLIQISRLQCYSTLNDSKGVQDRACTQWQSRMPIYGLSNGRNDAFVPFSMTLKHP